MLTDTALSRMVALDAGHAFLRKLRQAADTAQGDQRHQLRNRVAQLADLLRRLEDEL